MPEPIDVSLVVPVHDEAETIGESLASWFAAFTALDLRAECIVVDDGSSDGTPQILAAARQQYPMLRVITQPQSGHGAAVEAAYRAASGAWVMQIDGDDEIGAASFAALWAQRMADGMVMGRRHTAVRPPVRRAITRAAAAFVRRVAGAPIHDANVPYRLLPMTLLRDFLARVPPGLVAPNLAMSIYAGRTGWRIAEVPVVERPRVATRQPLGGARLWRAVFRAARQSAQLARQWRTPSARS